MSARVRFRELLEAAGRVHLDAPVIALHLLGQPPHAELTRLLFTGLRAGEYEAQTSALTLYQLLAEAYRRGAAERAARAERYLTALPGLEVVPVGAGVARQGAEVVAQLGGRPERALQLATALAGDARLFLTARSALRRVAGVQVASLETFVRAGGEVG